MIHSVRYKCVLDTNVIHPYWLRDIVSETGSEMANSQVALMAKDLETTVGKQYRVEFDLSVNDTSSFDFFFAGAWRSYLTGIAEPIDFNGFESIVPLDGNGSFRLDFTATTDQYEFEIVGFSDNAMSKPEIAYSIDNFSFNLFDIDSTELLWKIGFDSLPEDIYSYFVEEEDTLSMGIILYDTIENRLRVNLLEEEAPEYVGILMKDVVLEAERYYRFRPTISVISSSNDLTGVMALTSGHSESNIRDMKIFDVNQASEMIFYSDSGGLQTLLLGVVGDSSTYYYVDSLSLELLDMSISELYSNDFSTSAAGWRSTFADSLELTAGRIDWQSEEETMRIWPWGNDVGVIGSVVREIDVEPGIYNMVMAKVTLPDHPNAKVSLGVYDELAANVNFSTLSVEPMAHAVAEDFEETILYFTFRPNTDKMSLVMMYQGAEFGRVILDDVKVISIEPYERDTLLSMTFDDTSGVYDDWRSSIWPDSLISNDSILLSYISHDTLQGRMRLDMVEDVNNEEEGIIFGAATRILTGLEVGRPYEISFEIQTDGTSQLKQANVGIFPNSMFSMGIVWDSQDSEELDSIEVLNADSITLRFTATESDMVIYISANARRSAPYHYYIDNFQLKEGFVKTVNCDRSNLLLANQENRYRFGFNGQEKQTELGPSFTTAEYWMYDGRLGRRWNKDPKSVEWESVYAVNRNSPISNHDPNGDTPLMGAVIGAFTEYAGLVGSKMLFEGMTFSDANKDLNWRDGLDIVVAGGFGAASGALDGGIANFSAWISKPTNRKILVKLLEVGVSALEGSLKQIYKDEDFDLKSILAGALTEVGLGSLLKTDVYKDAADQANHNANVAAKRAEDLATRKSPNDKLISNAKEEASSQKDKAKSMEQLDNAGKVVKGTVAKTGANKAQDVTK